MNPRSAARRIVPLAAAAAVGVAAGIAAYSLSGHGNSSATAPTTRTVVLPAQQVSSTSSPDSLTQLYKQDAPGVVYITVHLTTTGGGINPFGLPTPTKQKEVAIGTGFEIDSKGDILTAEHVVGGASSIKVTFQDGSTANATLVGIDKSTDTGVIHVNVPAGKLHPLTLGDSAAVQPGQEVVAIGTPFSPSLAETMTAGIVSAVNRNIVAPNNFSIAGAIQTDAAINHGNSGGPLIDVATNSVIGINDQIPAETTANAGIGFAVPINSSKKVAQTLIAGGTVQHAYIGVEIRTAPSGGVTIASVVPGTPAASAGLKAGDVITAWNGRSITNADALTAQVTSAKPGDKVTLTIRRGGSTKQITVTLGVQPASAH
jgi:putative serine protease PepD